MVYCTAYIIEQRWQPPLPKCSSVLPDRRLRVAVDVVAVDRPQQALRVSDALLVALLEAQIFRSAVERIRDGLSIDEIAEQRD